MQRLSEQLGSIAGALWIGSLGASGHGAEAGALSPLPAPQITASYIDPRAVAVLCKSISTYRDLLAYSAEVSNNRGAHGTVAWERPNKFRYQSTQSRATHSGDTAELASAGVSNGTTYWKQTPDDPAHYYKLPLDEQILHQSGTRPAVCPGLWQFVFNDTLGAQDRVDYMFVIGNPNVVSAIPGKPEMCDAVLCDTVIIAERFPESIGNAVTEAITLSLGATDHLVRKVVVDAIAPGRHEHLVETHSKVTTPDTLPDDLFTFRAPTGVSQAGGATDLLQLSLCPSTSAISETSPTLFLTLPVAGGVASPSEPG